MRYARTLTLLATVALPAICVARVQVWTGMLQPYDGTATFPITLRVQAKVSRTDAHATLRGTYRCTGSVAKRGGFVGMTAPADNGTTGFAATAKFAKGGVCNFGDNAFGDGAADDLSHPTHDEGDYSCFHGGPDPVEEGTYVIQRAR